MYLIVYAIYSLIHLTERIVSLSPVEENVLLIIGIFLFALRNLDVVILVRVVIVRLVVNVQVHHGRGVGRGCECRHQGALRGGGFGVGGLLHYLFDLEIMSISLKKEVVLMTIAQGHLISKISSSIK